MPRRATSASPSRPRGTGRSQEPTEGRMWNGSCSAPCLAGEASGSPSAPAAPGPPAAGAVP
eukprot:89919-Alexandrium_andersonii.AAC.1